MPNPPLAFLRSDWERIVLILNIFGSGGCGGAHGDLAIEGQRLAALLETQLNLPRS